MAESPGESGVSAQNIVLPALPVSDWYATLGHVAFPHVFWPLPADTRQALVDGEERGKPVQAAIDALNRMLRMLPGYCFPVADVCAPVDAPRFAGCNGAVKTGRKAWDLFIGSGRVRAAAASGACRYLALRPYRRMDSIREFRLFVRDRQLVAASQMNLKRHFARLEGRRAEVWKKAQALVREVAADLPMDDLCLDVYLTSTGHLLLVDLNPFGPPTKPLLLRRWDRDWSEAPRLHLIPPPMELGGEVQVNF